MARVTIVIEDREENPGDVSVNGKYEPPVMGGDLGMAQYLGARILRAISDGSITKLFTELDSEVLEVKYSGGESGSNACH